MTPIKLRMAAFGAYVEPVELNFEDGLRGEKIFLIHGVTGAGKTTILDAISYALYGETSGKARDIKDMRSKGVADDILTEVEFTFALGDKTFRIKREVNYSSKRKDNKYQKKAALFENGNSIATGDSDIKNKITELLGFNAEQFWQVVLLPQGEFKKFLSSDSDKRQEVLNVLFDSTPYKKIEEALLERAKTSAAEVKDLTDKRDDLEKKLNGADSDSLEEVDKNLTSAKEKLAKLKKSSDDAQSELTDGKILANKFADLEKIRSARDVAQIQSDEAEKIFAATQSEYQKREAEDSARKELDKKIRELKEIQTAYSDWLAKCKKLAEEQEKFATAEKNFTDYENKAKRYDERLNQLLNDKARLECEKILGEIRKLETDLTAAQEKVSLAEKKLNAAQIELNRLQIVNNAARLAMTLKEGEPCPVCGSLEHPAIIAEAIPTVAELRAAEDKVTRLTNDKARIEKSAAKIDGELSAKKNQLAEYANTPELAAAEKSFIDLQNTDDKLEYCKRQIEKGKKYIEDNKTDLNKADKNKNNAKSAVDKLEGAISELKKKIPEIYYGNKEQLDADLNSAQKEFAQLDNDWTLAQKNFHDAENKKSAREATLKSLQKNFNDRQTELEGKTPPDIPTLEQKFGEARKKYDDALDEKIKLENTLNTLKKYSAELAEIKIELAAKEKIAETWRRLSDTANATGKGESELKISFQRYFLSMMFNDVVTEANNRLKKMSNGRYLFQMKDAGKTKAKTAGLNLEIFDEQNGALRPVETLSGGESFLASLSLALGLASAVRNKVGGIKLDTIFIDEGFGSLDSETLDFAISTIIEQSGGRLVGIISHVEELKNQMPVRLEVKKGKTGSTAEFIS